MKKKRSSRRRPRRRNPKLDVMGTAIAAGGGLLMAAASWAANGLNVGRVWLGAGKAALGLLAGGVATMASEPLGHGIAAGGVATGGYDLLSAGLDATSKPAATESQDMSAIEGTVGGRQRILRRADRRRQLSGASQALGAIEAMVQGERVIVR